MEILPDHVANQIAAGEVVERPASVVKELVENALDAGASQVEVFLRGGGKSEIRVVDDGHGMDRSDAVLALDRHATSKIRRAEDLRHIASFGFRGEALPSIAAVSRFELHTSGPAGEGTRARVDFGRIRSVDERPRRTGTTVTVKALFHDLPARARFLRTAAAETRASSEAVLLLALTNPRIGFRLESNDRTLLQLDPGQDWPDRIEAIWGDLASTLIPVAGPEGVIRVSGLVQRPDAARPRGGRRYLFVNGRPFRDKGLNRVVDEAFRTTVVEGMRPSFFLRLDVDPEAVDVNVHPAKSEVRFENRTAIESAVHAAVLEALAGLESTKPIGPAARRPAPDGSKTARTSRPVDATGPAGMPQLALFVPGDAAPDREGPLEPSGSGPDRVLEYDAPELWPLHDRYILASTRDGLLIVDQHSAHERVLYQEVMDRFQHGGATSQALLFPVTLRFSPAEADAIAELGGLLERLGFDLKPFGERTFILTASPAAAPAVRCRAVPARDDPGVDGGVATRRFGPESATSASPRAWPARGAIKAGERLSPEEMRDLFDRLFATELPGHDVHGRPTIVRLTIDELDRRFGRS